MNSTTQILPGTGRGTAPRLGRGGGAALPYIRRASPSTILRMVHLPLQGRI